MKKMKKIIALVFSIYLLQTSIYAMQEVEIYTIKKYNADYSKLDEEQKNKVKKEYSQIELLSKKVLDGVKDTNEYKTFNNLLIIDIWSNQFINNYKAKEAELKEIYRNNNFKTNPKYKMKTLTLKDKKRAESIVEQLNERKGKEKRAKLFEFFVKKDSLDIVTKKQNGNIDWISEEKLIPAVRNNISKLKVNDFITLQVEDNIQIVYLHKKEEARKASYEEAKDILIQLAKKIALNKEIEKLVK